MTTPEELADLLKTEMAARNWSIKDLSRESKVTFEVVRRAVHGQSAPSWPTVAKILAALDTDFVAVKRTPGADLDQVTA